MRVLTALWFFVWVVIGLPLTDFSAEPQWWRLTWVPVRGPNTVSDVILNVLFFAAFGGLAATWGWKMPRVLIAAGAISVATEFSQVFAQERYPAGIDVAANLCGALMGVIFLRVWRQDYTPRVVRGSGN